MPGLVKVGYTTVGSEQRARGLSSRNSAVPDRFEVAGKVTFGEEVSELELGRLERKAHRFLENHRYADNREFFQVSPEQALTVLCKVQQEAAENLAMGLNPSGIPEQLLLPKILELIPEAERLDRSRRGEPKHWHVWTEYWRDENLQVKGLLIYSQTYLSRRGVTAQVRRDNDVGVFSEPLLCRDPYCPEFGPQGNDDSEVPERDSGQAVNDEEPT